MMNLAGQPELSKRESLGEGGGGCSLSFPSSVVLFSVPPLLCRRQNDPSG